MNEKVMKSTPVRREDVIKWKKEGEIIRKIKLVNSRSILNHFAFHLSNPLTILIRNIAIKYLTKNKRFLENYLGKIYKN